jgi:hypothetical protein
MPLVSDVQRNGPTLTELPYRRVERVHWGEWNRRTTSLDAEAPTHWKQAVIAIATAIFIGFVERTRALAPRVK